MALQRQFGVGIVGGGPAGVAVLLAAHRDGRLVEMLQHGVLIVEQSDCIGRGQIGNYAIYSDSTGYTFIDPLRAGDESALHQVLETPVARRLAAAGPAAVPLSDAGEFLGLVGQALHTIIDRYPSSAVLTRCTAQSARQLPSGGWQLSLKDAAGTALLVDVGQLILATGAAQPRTRLEKEFFAGMPVVEHWGDRLLQSGEAITPCGLAQVSARLRTISNPSVAILGGSTSAMSVAYTLLNRLPDVRFGEGGITLFHRRPLRVYYTTPQEALADGYTEFGPEDLCPLSNRVFRLGGMRLDSRELLMQVRGIGGRPPEPRMRLHQLQQEDPGAVKSIDSAHLVIAALGYRPNALPILDAVGTEVRLLAHTGPTKPLVDRLCRVVDSDSNPIAGLFGIGLAAGFVPYGKLGGEPSFIGQANGLWLWQTAIGSMIVDAVLPPSSVHAAQPAQKALDHHFPTTPNGARVAIAAETGASPFPSH